MLVMKFGGTSVGSSNSIKQVVRIVQQKRKQGPIMVVISAMSGTTDQLISCGKLAAKGDESFRETLKTLEDRHLSAARELTPVRDQSHLLSVVKSHINELEDLLQGIFMLGELSARILDRLVSFGELLSSRIIAAAFEAEGKGVLWVDAREVIRTNDHHGNAVVDLVTTYRNVQLLLKDNFDLYIVPGFIGSAENKSTTTLGRGGSDYTAALLAGGLDADALEIWTDVSGMMTADPRWVPNAKPIPMISYKEAMELSHFGAKVIYPPTIQPVMSKNIPSWIKNTFAPEDPGTLIQQISTSATESISGISSINNIALLSLEGSGMVGIPGFSMRLFDALAREKINVILITQSSSEYSICVAVEASAAEKAMMVADNAFEHEIATGKLEPLFIEKNLSIIALVGDQMKSHPGISGRMFSALGRNGVNVRAIAQGSSERNISAVIATSEVKKALNVLHEAFFETTYRQVNLYIAGTGNVGKRLLAQLQQQKQFLMENMRLQLRVVGLINSRKMVMTEDGLNGNWEKQMESGTPADLKEFINEIATKNLRNSVFVDVTANETVASIYNQILPKSVSVVACNKIAASSVFQHYAALKDMAREYNTRFLFETNVGAGLPVIGTLNDLRKSGDVIQKIEAVLSGTLNFVFNQYDGTKTFSEVVRLAQQEGYTEPDPRLDLSGTDVMRKIMILAREAGERIEMESIANTSFLPASCMQGTVEDFYQELTRHESHFKSIYQEAAVKGCKLKFVACFANGKASVGLQHIEPQHDFYHLYGKDNIVRFYTHRYPEQPLVVKGAGAGADVTASGVFADILRTVG